MSWSPHWRRRAPDSRSPSAEPGRSAKIPDGACLRLCAGASPPLHHVGVEVPPPALVELPPLGRGFAAGLAAAGLALVADFADALALRAVPGLAAPVDFDPGDDFAAAAFVAADFVREVVDLLAAFPAVLDEAFAPALVALVDFRRDLVLELGIAFPTLLATCVAVRRTVLPTSDLATWPATLPTDFATSPTISPGLVILQ